MPKRNVLILDNEDSPWFPFLEEFFEDTPSRLNTFYDSASAGAAVDRTPQDIAFINPGLLSPSLTQKLKVLRQRLPDSRTFQIHAPKGSAITFPFEDFFHPVPSLIDFQKQLVQHLVLPEIIRVLVVDDEQEIGAMMRDFFERRVNPTFEIEYAENGAVGLEMIKKKRPDVLVLDVKMPVKDGREVYREIKKNNWDIPVIIFFDAISGDEMVEIHKIGRPAVVEKGARQSAMPEMMTLIKKMAFFG